MTAGRQVYVYLGRILSPQALALALLVAVIGCSSAEVAKPTGEPSGVPEELAGPEPAPARAALEVCEAQLGKTSPVHAVGNIYLAGQPEQADLAGIADRGIKRVVSLRKPGELDWDEAAAVRAAGMEYVAIPFDGPEELTDEVFARAQQVLKENADEPLLLHCGRANRVGAVWMVHRVLDDGVGIDAALAEAKTVGLRTPEYITKAQDYIKRAQAQAGPSPPEPTGSEPLK